MRGVVHNRENGAQEWNRHKENVVGCKMAGSGETRVSKARSALLVDLGEDR